MVDAGRRDLCLEVLVAARANPILGASTSASALIGRLLHWHMQHQQRTPP